MTMRLLRLTLFLSAMLLASSAEDQSKSRDKRQQLSYHPRRVGKPPPYAVQMEPPVRYSQRDPLYNPLASAKSDDFIYDEPHHHNPYSSEPEPIIEIIIKESNESLPTPVPPTHPPVRPTKEPIQVFYVKYEKHDQGDGKSKVIYDTPVPALNPHEEHEEIKAEGQSYDNEPVSYVTPAPAKEPTTTLRAIIRPESESYHAGGSGIRVTFGTEQLPPNSHNKRSDLEGQKKVAPPSPPPTTSRKQHGPFPPPPIPHRVPPAFPQQRIVNSFSSQQQLPQNYPVQPHFQGPPPRYQRPAISIQGLPEVQQRLPFQTFSQPHRVAINHPQQPGFPPALSVSHQSVNLQNQSPQFLSQPSFIDQGYHQQQVQLYRQQEEEKQRYHDQRRQQESQRQQEQQRQQELQKQQELQRQQDLQRQKEIQRQQEYQRIKQESKIREQQQQQFNQPPNFPQNHQILLNNRVQSQPQYHREVEKPSEILKAVPKLEQHYAIRENPHHPGPFPPNSQQLPPQFSQNTQNNFVQQHTQQSPVLSNHGNYVASTIAPLSQTPSSPPRHQGNQQFFAQNRGQAQYQQVHQPLASVWGRPVFKDSKQKIYATPVTHTTSQPKPTQRPVTSTTRAPPTTTTTTTTTTTAAPTTPRNEARIKENIANLPDEVPDDIRQQLLSSGILGNADIQVLDYDKVGGINIENLPPEALANFYGAGGGGVVSASEPVPSIAKYQKTSGAGLTPKKATSKVEQATLKPGGVEMKVVRFDPNTAQGQAIADQHIREDATHLKPVTVGSRNDGQYNRYLPLKVSGTSFPIPDVAELKDRKISSVVVLAPVDYSGDELEVDRQSRKLGEPMPVKFLAGDSLKQLIKKPSADNYKKWLEQERRTEPQKQSVVLLVTTPNDQRNGDKEIFMYDVTTQTVSKLSGDLSSAFVDAAESNADSHDSIDDSSFTH
ncbi:mastermind-like protein 2 [Diachasma alloeum]|uniref:mastermind-like protein 2 n=1 Tax=Diachasma alloeum TaxID=454923 RepID=UPI0007382C40|nr:mastermind-like protein 2 [Diachasma alloeum]